MLRRYWMEFDFTGTSARPVGTLLGVGVTAAGESDAVAIIRDRVFGGQSIPRVKRIVPDIAVDDLDPRHVRPNMGDVLVRGVWFPLGYP